MPEEQTEENKQTNKKTSLNNKSAMHLWVFIALLFFLVSATLVFVTYRFINHSDEIIPNALKSLSNQGNENKIPDDYVRRKIDGIYVPANEENTYPIAVMIDNHADARPQASLSKANLVFEVEAEGGLTRYLAFFASGDNLEKIGPVRSARPYFIDWARELSALYVHVGGSPEALVKMTKENILHINEFYNGSYFWRDNNRPRPHNVFSSSENLNNYLKTKSLDEGKFFSWQYKDDTNSELRGEKSEITIDYRLIGYDVKWQYNPEDNLYKRFLGISEHKDSDGSSILAKNIIIQYVEAEEIDEKFRLRVTNIGTGKAIACMDGKCNDIIWKKKSASARTRYYDDSETEIKLNAGTTWVQVVQEGYEVTY